MSQNPPVSDLETHLGYWLRMVSNAVSHGFARQVDTLGVTVAEWVFLRSLYNVDQLSPTRLAETMGMTKGAITKLADRLITKNLVARLADRNDKRAQTLALTGSGRALVPQLAALADENDSAFFSALSQDERDTLRTLLTSLVRHKGLALPPTE
jgi:DNA-binding MarR family transcriptional regulator